MNAKYCRRQIELSMLRAQWWIASATSGHYRQRKLHHASLEGPEFTDEEKLHDALATADRHIELAANLSDKLAEFEDYAAQMMLGRMRKAGLVAVVHNVGSSRWTLTAASKKACP